MRRYFLGLAAGFSAHEAWRHATTKGTDKDCCDLRDYLSEKYQGRAILTKNGRSGLALALMAYFDPGDAVMVNGFTCYAVYEAVRAAGLTPVWVDINKEDLNFDMSTISAAWERWEKQREANGGEDNRGGTKNNRENVESNRGEAKNNRGDSVGEIKGIIVQNTLGNPVDMSTIEKFAKKHKLLIIEDLAHCVGVMYPDGREAGTVGVATALSFGKDKRIDATSGGAVIMREKSKYPVKAAAGLAERYQNRREERKTEAKRASAGARQANAGVGQMDTGAEQLDAGAEQVKTGVEQVNTGVEQGRNRGEAKTAADLDQPVTRGNLTEPYKPPVPHDMVRARLYPLFGLVARGLSYVHLGTPWMWLLLKLHWVERSADNRLDVQRKIAKFEAKAALAQLKKLGRKKRGAGPLRKFYLVENRGELLEELKKQGYYLSGFWYERPVSPARYYAKVKFPEAECPVATEVAQQIVNLPDYYSEKELAPAKKLIKKYEITTREAK